MPLFHALMHQRGPNTFSVCKVKGHATQQDLERGDSTLAHKVGNDLVDERATEARELRPGLPSPPLSDKPLMLILSVNLCVSLLLSSKRISACVKFLTKGLRHSISLSKTKSKTSEFLLVLPFAPWSTCRNLTFPLAISILSVYLFFRTTRLFLCTLLRLLFSLRQSSRQSLASLR